MKIAITRQVSRSIANCELTFLQRDAIDVDRARSQHAQYEAALRDHGMAVLSLPEQPDMPDAVFVEDTALVLDECAILTRPGAASRLPETDSIARVLAPFRELHRIVAPGSVDGGDILCVGKRIYVGLSQRSNSHALQQLDETLAPRGYELRAVAVRDCLHLKSAVSEVAPGFLLVNPAWIDKTVFQDVKTLEIDASEPYAANALMLDDGVMFSAAFPRTAESLERAGLSTVSVECDELAKAEGALTCCSLIFTIQ